MIEEVEKNNEEADKDKEGHRDRESEERPSSMPSFSLGIEDVDNPTTSNKMNETQVETTEKNCIQSPYIQKVVDPYSEPTPAEALIANWMFALQGDEL